MHLITEFERSLKDVIDERMHLLLFLTLTYIVGVEWDEHCRVETVHLGRLKLYLTSFKNMTPTEGERKVDLPSEVAKHLAEHLCIILR